MDCELSSVDSVVDADAVELFVLRLLGFLLLVLLKLLIFWGGNIFRLSSDLNRLAIFFF